MRKLDFKNITREDLSYAILSNEAINFGYITRKEMEMFYKFLLKNEFIKKIEHCKNYEVMISFCYQSPKRKKTDECLAIVNLHKINTYIDYDMRETEFLEVDD